MTFRPVLIVVCGLPGVGKTTVGQHLADELDVDLVRTDVVRKELFPDPDYTDAEEQAVYRGLFENARESLNAGENIVLDGTFHNQAYRDRARDIATDHDSMFKLVYVTCREEIVRERIEAREGDESDATFRIHQQYREKFDAVESQHTRVNNEGSVAEMRRQLRTILPTPESAD